MQATSRTFWVGVVVEEDLAERGTPEFYREQAARLAAIAADISDHSARLELLEIAAVFQRLAQRADARSNVTEVGEPQSKSA